MFIEYIIYISTDELQVIISEIPSLAEEKNQVIDVWHKGENNYNQLLHILL